MAMLQTRDSMNVCKVDQSSIRGHPKTTTIHNQFNQKKNKRIIVYRRIYSSNAVWSACTESSEDFPQEYVEDVGMPSLANASAI